MEALRASALKGEPYSIALLTQRLQDRHGMALVADIRHDAMLKDRLPLILISSLKPCSPEEMRKAGLNGYLGKPFYPEQLKSMLHMVLDSHVHKKEVGLVTRHNITRALHEAKPGPSLTQYTGKHALVVEDMQVNLLLIKKLLSKHDITIDAAMNGKEAVEKIQNVHYDIVLMDCQMPEMDGFEATRHIRAHEEKTGRRRIPIVALTADAMTGDREKCILAGMDDYLNKPLRPKEIAAMLEKWLGLTRVAA